MPRIKRNARIKLPDGSEVTGEILAETDVVIPDAPTEETVTPHLNPADTAKILEPAPPANVVDTPDSLDALERDARTQWQNAIDAAKVLATIPDRHTLQHAVDLADKTLNAVLADVADRRRALQL